MADDASGMADRGLLWAALALAGASAIVVLVDMSVLGYLLGFCTSYPVSWWLLRRGIKEAI